jgi:hypothetical protein
MLLTDAPPQLQAAARHMVIKQSSNVRFPVQKATEKYEAGMHISLLQFVWISVQSISRTGSAPRQSVLDRSHLQHFWKARP